MRGNESKNILRVMLVLIGSTVVPLVLVVLTTLFFTKPPHLGRDLYRARLTIENDLRLGSSRAEVQRYVEAHFDTARYDEIHRCLIARHTAYSGGRYRVVEQSMLTFFYFDSSDVLLRIAHRSKLMNEMELTSPEETAKRWEDNPTMQAAKRLLQDTDASDEQLNKELMETAAALRQLLDVDPSTQPSAELYEALDRARRSTTRPTDKRR